MLHCTINQLNCAHLQFHCRGNTADAHIWAVIVVCPEPLLGRVLSLLDALDEVLVQPFVPDRAIVALKEGVLLRQTRLRRSTAPHRVAPGASSRALMSCSFGSVVFESNAHHLGQQLSGWRVATLRGRASSLSPMLYILPTLGRAA